MFSSVLLILIFSIGITFFHFVLILDFNEEFKIENRFWKFVAMFLASNFVVLSGVFISIYLLPDANFFS